MATVKDLRLNTPINEVAPLGARRAAAFARLGIGTVSDLIRHLPMRYEKQWAECPIGQLQVGLVSSTRGTIVATRVVPGGRRAFRGGQAPSPDSKRHSKISRAD